MNNGRHPSKSIPYRAQLECGCVMPMSKGQYLYGAIWCPRHKREVVVSKGIPVVPRNKPPMTGQSPLF